MESPSEQHTESWNGTNWTEVNNLNTAEINLAGAAGASNTSGIFLVVTQLTALQNLGMELTGQKLKI